MRYLLALILFSLVTFNLQAQSIMPGDTKELLIQKRGEPDQIKGLSYIYYDQNDINSKTTFTLSNGYISSKIVSWKGSYSLYKKMVPEYSRRVGKMPDKRGTTEESYVARWDRGKRATILAYSRINQNIILMNFIMDTQD